MTTVSTNSKGTEKKKAEKIHLGDAQSIKRVIDEQAVEVCLVICYVCVI